MNWQGFNLGAIDITKTGIGQIRDAKDLAKAAIE